MEFLLNNGNMFFTAALIVVVLFIALELIGLVTGGFSALNSFDIEFPEMPDIPGLSFFEVNAPNAEKRVPTSIIMFMFFLFYGSIGIIINNLTGALFAGVVLNIIVLIPTFIFVKLSSRTVAKMVPSFESEVVSEKSFLGEECEIIVGTAKKGRAAQARYVDPYGTQHTFMIEPLHDTDVKTGEKMTISAFNKEKDGFFYGYKSMKGDTEFVDV